MGAARFNGVDLLNADTGIFVGHGVDRCQQTRQLHQRGNTQGGGNGVVGGLPHVDVVVRVDRRVDAFGTAQCDVGEIGHHLVAVHVVAGTGTGLETVNDELIDILTGEDLVAGIDNRPGHGIIEPAGLIVGDSGSAFDQHMGFDKIGIGAAATDRKVDYRAGSLGTVPRIGGNTHLAQAVFFDPELRSIIAH